MLSFTIEAGGAYLGHVFFLLKYENRDLYCSSNTLNEVVDYGRENGLYIPVDKIKKVIKDFLIEQENGSYIIDSSNLDSKSPITSGIRYLKSVNERLKLQIEDFHN